MKQVLLRPLWDMGLGNRLFDTIYPWSLTKWRESAAKLGIALDSWDTMPLDRADCVWLLDLPDRKATLDDARRRARPGVPFVLQVMETPSARAHNFHPANQALCDYVVTYQRSARGRPNHFFYRLPHSLSFEPTFVPFAERRTALMVNSNRVAGWLALRQPGLVGLPGVGRQFSGWKLPWWARIRPARGELYSWRRRLARVAEATDPDALDIIGPNWSGERISWSRFFSPAPYRCCIGRATVEKWSLAGRYKFCISVENFRGHLDYISEKIFDALIAGSVPVYLGDERIADLVPREAMVDVRDFRSHRELLRYLRSCPEAEWARMRSAGQQFLQTPAAREFSTDHFVGRMNEILQQVLGLKTRTAASAASR